MYSAASTPYGKHLQLLEIRRWVLESAGHHVRTTATFREWTKAASHACFDLLILCHSLSQGNAQTL